MPHFFQNKFKHEYSPIPSPSHLWTTHKYIFLVFFYHRLELVFLSLDFNRALFPFYSPFIIFLFFYSAVQRHFWHLKVSERLMHCLARSFLSIHLVSERRNPSQSHEYKQCAPVPLHLSWPPPLWGAMNHSLPKHCTSALHTDLNTTPTFFY